MRRGQLFSVGLIVILIAPLFFFHVSEVAAATGNATFTVYNSNGSVAYSLGRRTSVGLDTTSGTYIGTQSINPSSQAIWSNLATGQYYVYVSHNPGSGVNNFNTEYWGSWSVTVNSGQNSFSLTRFFPIIGQIQYSDTSPKVGELITVTVTADNIYSQSESCSVDLFIDRNKNPSASGPWDYNSFSSAQTISPQGTSKFTFQFTPSVAGTYYADVVLDIWFGSSSEPTDTSPWGTYVTVSQATVGSVSLSLSSGRIVSDDSVTVTATATVRDTNNNLMSGVPVTFGSSGYTSFTPSSGVVQANGGQAQVTVYSCVSIASALTVTISASAGGKSKSKSLVVSPPLSASASANTHTVDSGNPVSFIGSASGGIPPYSYSWNFGDGSPASTLQNPSNTYSSLNTNTYTATLIVTDNGGFGLSTPPSTWSVTVHPQLTVSISPPNPTINQGESETFNALVTGGNSPYTYIWYVNSVPQTCTSTSFTYTPPTATSYTISIKVTDATSASTQSIITLTVVPSTYTITSTQSSLTVTAGGSTTYSISVTKTSGSPTTVTLSVTNAPSGVTCSFNNNNLAPTFSTIMTVSTTTSAASGTVTLTIQGTGGGVATQTYSFTLTINPAPTSK